MNCEYQGTGAVHDSCSADSAQAVGPEQPTVDERVVGEIPGVRMRRINASEGGEKLAALELQTPRQIGRLHERFLDFDLRFIVVIELENNVGEPFEVRIDGAVERELEVARVEAALLRIVVAHFELVEIGITRPGERKLAIERDVHVVRPPPAIVIGAVNDAPAPADEYVSVEVVTDASVVGNGALTEGGGGDRLRNGRGHGQL